MKLVLICMLTTASLSFRCTYSMYAETPRAPGVSITPTEQLIYSADRGSREQNMPTIVYASWHGSVPMVAALIARGDDVNAEAKDGTRAIHLAAFWGYKEVVALLWAHGARLEVYTKTGKTPLEMARKNGHEDVAVLIEALLHGAGATE